MADKGFILAPETVTVKIALEPVYNLLTSFLLLAEIDHRSNFNDWVAQTPDQMPPERLANHRLIFDPLSLLNAILPEESFDDFPSYIDHIARQDPLQLRDQAFAWLKMYQQEMPDFEQADQQTLLADVAAYLRLIEQIIHTKQKPEPDFEFFRRVHQALNQPAETHALIVSHLRYLWEEVIQSEWKRVQPMLQDSVNAFQEIDFSRLTTQEAIRIVTGRDLSSFYPTWSEKIIFVPSAHIGPYVMRYESETERKMWLVFGARLPEGARAKSPALSRSELLVQLNALADDTRLRILELLTQQPELCAQDIITMLDLSQSSASRHLRQLTASGYLTERRREVSKCYTLNLDRVDATLAALKKFLHGK